MKKQKTFNNSRETLSKKDKQQIFELLSSGLRAANRELLQLRLEHHLNMIPHHGILSRIMYEHGTWTYCAGQSYPDEIRTVRKIILECK